MECPPRTRKRYSRDTVGMNIFFRGPNRARFAQIRFRKEAKMSQRGWQRCPNEGGTSQSYASALKGFIQCSESHRFLRITHRPTELSDWPEVTHVPVYIEYDSPRRPPPDRSWQRPSRQMMPEGDDDGSLRSRTRVHWNQTLKSGEVIPFSPVHKPPRRVEEFSANTRAEVLNSPARSGDAGYMYM